MADLAVIGEPHAAVGVEHDVVRAHERMTVALAVEHLHLAGREIDALDAATGVVGGLLRVGDLEAHHLDERPAAAVAHVDGAVGTDRDPVGASPILGDRLDASVRMHPVDGA